MQAHVRPVRSANERRCFIPLRGHDALRLATETPERADLGRVDAGVGGSSALLFALDHPTLRAIGRSVQLDSHVQVSNAVGG